MNHFKQIIGKQKLANSRKKIKAKHKNKIK